MLHKYTALGRLGSPFLQVGDQSLTRLARQRQYSASPGLARGQAQRAYTPIDVLKA
jgi:hypothetical protein